MMIRSNGNVKQWFMLVGLVFVMVACIEVWEIRVASAATKPVKLRMMMSSEPVQSYLSPIGNFAATPVEPIAYNVMEPLVGYTKDGPIPKLATKWEHSADLKKWRFYLRKGVKFHNGDNFTARDVVELAKWSFEEKKLSELYKRLPIKEAVAVDDYTVDLIFEEPQPLLFIMGRRFLIPPTAITRDNREMAFAHPIGTGPYKFVEWNRGMSIKMARFEGYWGPKPQIENVEITFRGEVGVRLAALLAGEVDWVYGLGPEQAGRAPKIARMPSPETVWFKLDEYIQTEFGGVSILADKRLRIAVEYAIDRQALVALYGGFATPSLGQLASPGDFGFNPNLKSRPYDLEQARALVKEAGAVGKTITMGTPVDRWSKAGEVTEAIAYMIEKTGLKVKLRPLPYAEAVKYHQTQGANRPYNMDMFLWPSDTLMEVETRFEDLFVEGGKQCANQDKELTRLFKDVLTEADIPKRGEKLGKAYAYAYEQAHYIPVFKLEWIWGLAKNLEWKLDIGGRPFFADMKFTD